MAKEYLLGIDLGTTGVKVTVFEPDGKPVCNSYREYPLLCENPGWAEQDPQEWWDALCACVQELTVREEIARSIVAIGVTGQQSSVVLIGEDGEILCNSLIWMDRRSAAECRELEETLGLERLYYTTGLRPDPMYSVHKLLWIRTHWPEVFRAMRSVLQPKDYINLRLTGVAATDVTCAAATQAFDIHKLRWDREILEAAEIPPTLMPEVRGSSEPLSKLLPTIAAELGLGPDIPVVTGGGDTTVSALGCGVAKEGDAAIVIGTSSDVVTCIDAPIGDPQMRLGYYPYVLPGKYLTIAGANTSGVTLRWFRDEFFKKNTHSEVAQGREVYDVMMEGAEKIPPGSDGLVFLPYFSGQRSPIYDPNARGVFAGINLMHTEEHFIRAIVEGVSLSIRDRLQICRDLGFSIKRTILTGGGAKSELWRQIITDMIAQPTLLNPVEEAASLGAVQLAAVGAGIYPDLPEACRRMTATGHQLDPDPENRERYNKLFDLYRKLYRSNRSFFDDLAEIE